MYLSNVDNVQHCTVAVLKGSVLVDLRDTERSLVFWIVFGLVVIRLDEYFITNRIYVFYSFGIFPDVVLFDQRLFFSNVIPVCSVFDI